MRHSKSSIVSFAAAATLGLITGFPAIASAGGLKIDINLGIPAPQPPVVQTEVVVVDFDHYCVGYRRSLYDADWRLRNAQIEQWHAQEALDAARHREGEVTVLVEDQEAFVVEYERKVADSNAALAAARAAAARAADDAAFAAARMHAYEKRIQGAKDDLEAADILHEAPAREDADRRIHANEAALAAAAAELHAAEGRRADLAAAEAAAAGLNDFRVRLTDYRGHLPQLRIDLTAAHDEVFAARQRLDAAIGTVALALHDRDEALWMLHRDEILSGRATFASCGFTVDLGVWGGRMPSDPEVVHAYFVHPVTYWVERPVEIQTRVVEVDQVTEISHVRRIQEKHEGPRFHEVAKFEATVPVETRRQYAQRVTVERERLTAERTERAAATAEHRAPRIPDTERAEARAIVGKARAEAKATNIEANAQARAEVTNARGDAKAERIEAKAEQDKARADARAERTEARAEVDKAHADARAKQIEAQADARKERTEAKAEVDKAHADARAKQIEAQADAKAGQKPNHEAKADPHNAKDQKGQPAASAHDPHNKDPRNKPKDGQAAIDPAK